MKPNIFKYTLGEVDFFYNKDFDDPSMGIDEHYFFKHIIERILDDSLPKLKESIDLHAEKNNLERIAILNVKGDVRNKKWCYSDGENLFSVQSWINKMDGKYKLLILKVCNEKGHGISSKKSIVCFPNKVYSARGCKHGEVRLELFVPK